MCFFGTGSCRGRGHRRVPVKALIRAQGNVMATVPTNEWGTSSRCPACKSKKKMKSCRRQKQEEQHAEHSGEEKVDEDKNPKTSVAASKRSNTSDHDSGNLESSFFGMNSDTDDRIEVCENKECEQEWRHDVVSMRNFSQIARNLIRGEERPSWLRPKRASEE